MTRFATLRLIWTATLIVCVTDAVACTCAEVTLETRYARSANVFTAVVVDEYIDPADQRTPVRSNFGITETFKGKPPFVAFVSHRSDASCGIALAVGAEYLFFAPDSGAIGLCAVVRRDHAESQLAALRSFVAGASPDLAEPWRFFGPSEHGCSLLTSFDVAENYGPGHLEISTSKRRATENPEFDVTELTIRPGRGIPNGRDGDPRPLGLTVNDAAYSAAWTTGRALRLPAVVRESAQVALPETLEVSDSYLLAGDAVEALLSALTMSRALRARYDANGFGPSFDIEVRTTNLGDAGVKMLDCIRSQQIR